MLRRRTKTRKGKKLGSSHQDKSRNGHRVPINTSSSSGHPRLTGIGDMDKKFKLAWTNYAKATELDKKSEAVQVATLLTVIRKEARDVVRWLQTWPEEDNATSIEPVLMKVSQNCQLRKNVSFERYRFNRCPQEPGDTYDQHHTTLRKLAESYEYQSITLGAILFNRLVFGIKEGTRATSP